MTISRRQFFERAAAASVGFAALRSSIASGALTRLSMIPFDGPYGPLVKDPRGICDLPRGFSYTLISATGEKMDDGLLVPGQHDGMAAFARADGKTVLVCNHEIEMPLHRRVSIFGEYDALAEKFPGERLYDRGVLARGGTTTVIYDTRTRTVERKFLSLAGTTRNCAGGPTPWGSWITCEEDVSRVGQEMPGGYEQDHGYAFEVPALAEGPVATPVALKAMGRFRREAVAIDPRTGIVYQTEDIGDGLIYRFIPKVPGKLAEGGRLQALCSKVAKSLKTQNWGGDGWGPNGAAMIPAGTRIPCSWIDLDEPEAPDDDLRKRGFKLGAAQFARAEGMWFGNDQRDPAMRDKPDAGEVFWACTDGGRARFGQIWRYKPSPKEGTPGEADSPGILELFIEPNDEQNLRNADNICVSPWGGLFICEDCGQDTQRLIAVTPKGECFPFASNSGSRTELAGVTAAPDGSALFVNFQSPGKTLAIHGPFKKLV